MHDLRIIRDDPAAFDAGLGRRGADPVAERLVALDAERRALETKLQEMQARRNEASKAIGQAMGQGDKDKAEALKAEVGEIKSAMPALEEEERAAAATLNEVLAVLPNIPADDVPDGADEDANVEVSRWGTPREFTFEPVEHADLGPDLGMEFETGAAMSGARFTFLRGQMARLHRALGQFMLDLHTGENGYTECNPPVLVRDEALFGTGQLPKFEDDLFQTQISKPKDEAYEEMIKGLPEARTIEKYKELQDRVLNDPALRRWLIPTAEVSLTNSVRESIIDDLSAPIRLTALTPCFRSEAGAAGRDTRGFIRQHQFEKVELVAICRPEDWEAEHAHMIASAEMVLEKLGLPYRKMFLCAGDMGATAKKTFDLEVWLPGQGAYREISSISWCGDYQARRMNARYRPEDAKGTRFVHTLNGSGLAVGRTLVAVLENFQQEDGSVLVPEVLHPYTGGMTRLERAD